jgi:hypothetical protein
MSAFDPKRTLAQFGDHTGQSFSHSRADLSGPANQYGSVDWVFARHEAIVA